LLRVVAPRHYAYRVAVFFRAAPLAAPTVVRSTNAGVENKKAVKSDPGGNQPFFWKGGTPYGVGVRLDGFLLGFHTQQWIHCTTCEQLLQACM
jgi:hypothetical protein